MEALGSSGEFSNSNGENPSDLLFINEMGDPATYKQRSLQDIRSHVGKHTARRFRERHKTGPRGRGERILPKISSMIHHQNSTKQHLSNRQPDVASWFPDTEIPASDGLHTAEQHVGLTEISEEAESQTLTGSCCKSCGKQSDGKQPDGEQQLSQMVLAKLSMETYFDRRPRKLSLIGNIGSGRVDPFASYPVVDANHEVIDLAVTYLIPGVLPDDVQRIWQPNSVSKSWITLSLKSPLLFNALLFSASVHYDFARWSEIRPNCPEILAYKLTAIRLLGEIMRDGDEAAKTSDEVILAVLMLGSHETLPVREEKLDPFNTPLRFMKWANFYGNIQFVPAHIKAVLSLVAARGGIGKLKLRGLAETIFDNDMLLATRSASKPKFPVWRMHERYIANVRAWATAPLRHREQLLGSGFWDLQDHGITDAMLQVFDAMGSTTIAIDYYIQGKPDHLTEGVLSRTRAAVQRRLLLLPPMDELGIIPLSRPCLYEACRLTGLIFGAVMMCSIPDTYDLFKILTRRLRLSLESAGLEGCESMSFEVQSALVWTLVLGGTAALGNAERSWYVSELSKMAVLIGLDTWESVEEIMEAFLWLESVCGDGGRLLWSDAMKLAK